MGSTKGGTMDAKCESCLLAQNGKTKIMKSGFFPEKEIEWIVSCYFSAKNVEPVGLVKRVYLCGDDRSIIVLRSSSSEIWENSQLCPTLPIIDPFLDGDTVFLDRYYYNGSRYCRAGFHENSKTLFLGSIHPREEKHSADASYIVPLHLLEE